MNAVAMAPRTCPDCGDPITSPNWRPHRCPRCIRQPHLQPVPTPTTEAPRCADCATPLPHRGTHCVRCRAQIARATWQAMTPAERAQRRQAKMAAQVKRAKRAARTASQASAMRLPGSVDGDMAHELATMARVAQTLDSLPDTSRARVVAWLSAKYSGQ